MSTFPRIAAITGAATAFVAALVAAALTTDAGRASATRTSVVQARLQVGPVAVWSPRRLELAFDGAVGAGGVYVVRPDGSGLRRVVRGSWPVWAPDGERLAAARYTEDHPGRQVYDRLEVVNRTGTRGRMYDGGAPRSWAPDGRRVAIQLETPAGEPWRVAVLDVRTGAVRPLTGERETSSDAQWSPRGDSIAYVAETGIYLVRPNGTGRRRLTTEGGTPRWSSDGRLLAYTAGGATHVIRPDGTGRRRLIGNVVSSGSWLARAAWAPKGRILAVIVKGGPLAKRGAFLVDTTTGRAIRRVLGPRLASNAWSLSWSHDARMLAFTIRVDTPLSGIYVVRADGTGGRFLQRRGR